MDPVDIRMFARLVRVVLQVRGEGKLRHGMWNRDRIARPFSSIRPFWRRHQAQKTQTSVPGLLSYRCLSVKQVWMPLPLVPSQGLLTQMRSPSELTLCRSFP